MKNKLAGVALAVGLLGGAGAGVILGVTQLSNAQTTTTTPADPAAPASPADPGATKSATGSNEDATHEAGESAQHEADENSGKAGFGHHRGGGSNEDPAHEAGESAAREAEEDAQKAAASGSGTPAPVAGTSASGNA